MSRTIGLILALLLAVCMALWGWSEASAARGQLNDQIKLREAAEARLGKVQTNLRTVSANYATSELRLRRVLDTIPDRRTPDAVYNELCQRAKCAKLDAVPTPAD